VYTSTQNPQFGNNTADKGVNDPDTSNIFFDLGTNSIQLDTASLATGTHDAYFSTGVHEDDVISTGTHDVIINVGSVEYQLINMFDTASGVFDSRSGTFDDIAHITNKLEDDNASFDSTWVGYTVRNTTANTTATVSSVDSSTVLTLSSDIFNGQGDSYRLEANANALRDTTASFTSALVGRTVRNTTDDTTASITQYVSASEVLLSSSIFSTLDGYNYTVEPGFDRLYDPSASFPVDVVGRTVRNTTDNTTTTVTSRVDGTELVLASGIFDNQDGEGYRIEVPNNILRDTTASFTTSSHDNRIIRNLDTGDLSTVASVQDGTTLVLADNIFGQTDSSNYKVEGDVQPLGYYYFTDQEYDLGSIYTSRITGGYSCNSFSSTVLFDGTLGLFDSNSGTFDGSDISSANASLEVSKTIGDPDATPAPTWTAWGPFFVGDYYARGARFRLKLTSSNSSHNIRVDSLSATIDMPDTTKRATGISSGALGIKSILYATPFKTTPTVGITMQDSASGDYYTISSDTALGFTVTFYNSSNTATQKSFNWMSTGY
jgi:hypothetical protein